MNEEELIKHCKRELEIAERIKRYDKHYLEHKLMLDIIRENQQLKKIINKANVYIEKFVPIDNDTFLMREIQKKYLLDTLNYKGVKNND